MIGAAFNTAAMDASAFASKLESHRPYLLRVALLQLRDPHLAEDVVQETMLAALQGERGFSGKSSLKTWLTGILKHKIVDAIRHKTRQPTTVHARGRVQHRRFDVLFDDTGHWENPPAEWGNPEANLSRDQFFDVMQICLDQLPANTARVFMMREVMELESDEICQELKITANNLWVMLYRARVALRMCLEQRWFGSNGANAPA